MIDQIWKYFSVYLFSGLKFILGPTMGILSGLHVLITIVLTVLGMMTAVYIFSFFSKEMFLWWKKWTGKDLSIREEKLGKYRNFILKYGLIGVAFLTPLILTPIGGTIIGSTISSNRQKLIFYMWISSIVWSTFFTFLLKFAHEGLLSWKIFSDI